MAGAPLVAYTVTEPPEIDSLMKLSESCALIVLAREASCRPCDTLASVVPLVKPMPVVLSVMVRLLVVPVAVATILPLAILKVVPGIADASAVITPPTVLVVVRSILVPVVAAPVLVKVMVIGVPLAPTLTTSVSPAVAMVVAAARPVDAVVAPVVLAEVSLAMVVKSCGFISSEPVVLLAWYWPFLGNCGRLS